jgi:hypothetical protein
MLQVHLYPIVVAVSAITTFTTPFMVKMAVPFRIFERKLPRKWLKISLDIVQMRKQYGLSVHGKLLLELTSFR